MNFKNKKNIFVLNISLIIIVGLLTGCSNKKPQLEKNPNSYSSNVQTNIYSKDNKDGNISNNSSGGNSTNSSVSGDKNNTTNTSKNNSSSQPDDKVPPIPNSVNSKENNVGLPKNPASVLINVPINPANAPKTEQKDQQEQEDANKDIAFSILYPKLTSEDKSHSLGYMKTESRNGVNYYAFQTFDEKVINKSTMETKVTTYSTYYVDINSKEVFKYNQSNNSLSIVK